MDNLLVIDQLTYKRNMRVLLSDVSLTIPTGSIIGLLGDNGAGKTTLMRLIAGAATNYQGSIILDGEVDKTTIKGMVSFSEQLSGASNDARMGDLAKFYDSIYPEFSMTNFNLLAKNFDLNLKQKLSQLSKGMRRNFVISITLARRARLYLLDEPFDGIDSMKRKKIIENILTWMPDNASVIVSDHHVSDIANLLDQVIIIKDRTVVNQIAADKIREEYNQSIEEYYESFYKEENDND
ncbi:ABC transporter ATPase [Paucilactobacillus oligofermentans DSM 15707 = LMG 22743]|uniref:ABC transporter ATPase n=1 Tax=Paucilactobacillus oligofermentans DSM 15707 = LMG 22743 TaxID=1423778 RepID=A0A0R1RJF0_9LACO|nr:ATP-binding cassette domain-containing protein [Paucilactobacillus oligofermentans]KRL55396.1 ABC transporter ATPase [Paucilactobacillus oligofermentans DSM 15707 = LMG 22743]CUS25614.1 ABC transporter ATP-binding protein [Paucilactobacillus oligofermentans DSM 15707 = LMG 22743]